MERKSLRATGLGAISLLLIGLFVMVTRRQALIAKNFAKRCFVAASRHGPFGLQLTSSCPIEAARRMRSRWRHGSIGKRSACPLPSGWMRRARGGSSEQYGRQ